MSFERHWLDQLLNPRQRRFRAGPREPWDPLARSRRTDTPRRWL